ncbi:MAG TPA: glycerophosphodiester phosphodiesterase family protein [Polyangiaceae bacterium]|jgi:glycerophosphoryl diester phosphodiesterase
MKCLLTACSLALLGTGGCDPRGLGRPNPDFLVIGHRGAPEILAENTVDSFDVAVALGANALETDVCITEDGVFVLWHDRDPDGPVAFARQSGAEGLAYIPLVPPIGSEWRRPVDQLTLDELREHYGYGNLTGRRNERAVIPTLDDLFDFARSAPELQAIYVDVKLSTAELDAARDLVGRLALAASEDDSLEHVRFFAMSPERTIVDAMEAARREPEAPELGRDALRVIWDFEGLGALAGASSADLRDTSSGLVPNVPWSAFKREVARLVAARENGRLDSVTVWTFDEPRQLAELLYYSVDGVMTNDPGALYGIWQDTLD